MNMKKLLAMTAALCMTTAVFASCGDSDDSSSEATTTTTTTAAEEETPAEETPAEEGGEESTEEGGETAEESSEEAADLSDQPYIDELTGLECFEPDPDYVPVTEFEGYDAFLMYADSQWFWRNMVGQGYGEEDRGSEGAFGVDADITGDGEYTVAITKDSIAAVDPVLGTSNIDAGGVLVDEDCGVVFPAEGATVFCVDITGICDGTTGADGEDLGEGKLTDGDDANVNKHTKGKYTGQELKVEVTSIKADGEEIPFDAAKIRYGNIEDDNNCYRIEIYNTYGNTGKDAPIAAGPTDLMFSKSLEVTFTIEGLDKE